MKVKNDINKFSQYIVFISIILSGTSAIAEHHEFEAASDLRARKVLPSDLLKGEFHKVDKVVRSDGYLNYYRIESDFGEFDATSTAMLRTRVGEINALAELNDLSKTEVFIMAAADAGVGQLKVLTQFATHPVGTVVGIPRGIGRMFKRYTRQAGDAVDTTKEFLVGDSDDSADSAEDEEDGDESDTEKVVGLTEEVLGVSSAQRRWAEKLGTDPYSTNEVLQAAINEVAWAERLGRLGMKFAGVPEIPGADIIGEVNEAVWSKDPYELQDLNRARLLATGADEALIEEYLENPNMTPSQQTLLTAAIAEIDGATGREGILLQALNTKTEAEANFLIKTVTMLAWYHLNKEPITDVLTYAAIPVGMTEDGTSTFLFAVDHVYWTETIANAARQYAEQSTANNVGVGEVWFLGTASKRTRKELADLGFAVHEEVALMMMAPSG